MSGDKTSSEQTEGRVLVVDDNADSRLLVAELLKLRGFDSAAVSSGREAVESLGTLDPEVIILDLQMPEMDGFATLAALRERDPALPVIAMSAHVLPEDERRMNAAGFDAALSKPVALDHLVQTVREVLARYRGGDAT